MPTTPQPELANAFRTNETYFKMMRRHNQAAKDRPNIENEVADFLLASQPGQKLLDAGCGEGSITLWVAKQLPKCQITGVDLSPIGVEMGAASAKKEKLNNLHFQVDNLEKLSLESASIDRVWSQSVVEHVPDLSAMFSELYRVMRPGAEGVIRLSNGASLPRFSPRHYLKHRLEPIPQKPSLNLEEGNYYEHRHNFDAHELASYTVTGLLEQAGFRIVRLVTFPDHLRSEPGPALRRFALRLLLAARQLPLLRLLGPTTIVIFKKP